jgi:hypothetical protein
MKIKLQNVRLSFPSLFKKSSYNGEETKFEATFLLSKDLQKDQVEAIRDSIKTMTKDDLKGVKLPPEKLCLRDGDAVDYDGYNGHMSLKASSKRRPLVIDRDKTPLTEEDGVVYGGCYVNAQIELWAQDNNYGKRINATLLGVQFARDGDAFVSGASVDADDFEDVSEEF